MRDLTHRHGVAPCKQRESRRPRPTSGILGAVERFFRLREHHATLRTEVLGGVTTFATMVLIVFAYNLGNGLTAGLILSPALKAMAGRARELNAGSVVLGLACLVYYVFGLPH